MAKDFLLGDLTWVLRCWAHPVQRPTAAAAAAAAPGADDGDGGGEGGGAVTLKLLVKRGGKEDRSKELQVG